MRVLIAQVMHETNTFSSLPADLECFRKRELIEGSAVLEALHATNSEIGGFIEGCRANGWEVVPVVAAEATPCGRVEAGAWRYFRDRIVAAVQRQAPVDVVLIALHGAMVCEEFPDADGSLIAAIRAVAGPGTLIGCTLDLHANPSDQLAAAANLLVPYRSYPHVDMRERGLELVELARQALADRRPRSSYVFRNRQLDGCDHGRSSGEVMPELVAMAARASVPGRLQAAICAGFPWADVEHAGPSVVVSGTVDRHVAEVAAEPLLRRMWETRESTSLVAHDPSSAWRLARELVERGRRVLIADYSDNPGGGGYGNTTKLLAALLENPGPATVFAPLCDSQAATLCAHAGEGALITVAVGGNPTGGFSGPELMLSGRVVRCAETQFRATGPMWTNREMSLGVTALVSCGPVQVVITSHPLQVTEPAYLSAAGADVDSARVIVIKSLQHFRAAFEPLVDDILFADSGGLVSTRFQQFPYRNVRRPIWPLDAEAPRQ